MHLPADYPLLGHRHHSSIGRAIRVVLPHTVVWAPVAFYVWSSGSSHSCTGFCSIGTGVVDYTLVVAALLLSLLIVVAQLAYLALTSDVGAEDVVDNGYLAHR